MASRSNLLSEAPAPAALLDTPSVAEKLPAQSSVTTQPSLDSLLAAHMIEPELLGPSPRWIQQFRLAGPRDRSVPTGFAVRLLLLALLLPLFAILGVIQVWLGLMLVISAGSLISHVIGWPRDDAGMSKRARNRLKDGIPTAALVVGINSVGTGREVYYIYIDRFGAYLEGKSLVAERVSSAHGLDVGSRFTLLVSPFDSTDAVPYFLVDQSRIGRIAATAVSANAARSAAKVGQQAYAQTYSLGSIEPELLMAGPRRIRSTSQWTRQCATFYTVCAGVATVIAIFYSQIAEFMRLGHGGLGPILPGLVSNFTIQFVIRGPFTGKSRLRNGIPSRALVVGMTPVSGTTRGSQAQLTIAYQYESQDGKVQSGTVVLAAKRAQALGIDNGSKFTVLYDAKDPKLSTPYFSITNAEIVGAVGPKITPP